MGKRLSQPEKAEDVINSNLTSAVSRETQFQYQEMSFNMSSLYEKNDDDDDSELPILMKHKSDRISLDDFTILKVVGRGAYGKVYQARSKKDGQYYAIKAMKKDFLMKNQQVYFAILERKIGARLQHPFIVQLMYAFQNSKRIYLVFEFMEGGELFQHLKESRKFQVDRTRQYAAQIALALEYIHSQDIIYRDLKLENLLMDRDGFIKLTDFGLAKISGIKSKIKIDSKSGGDTEDFICGTLEYLAPEVINNKEYGVNSDIWSYGITLYEMLSGNPPFWDSNKKKLLNKIVNDPINFDKIANPEAKDLLKLILNKNAKLRMTSFEDIKKHKFFSTIDWDEVLNKGFQPVYKPIILKSSNNLQYFDSQFTKELVQETPINSVASMDAFRSYSFDPDNFRFSMASEDDNFVNRVK